MDAAKQETGQGKKSGRKRALVLLPPGQRYCRKKNTLHNMRGTIAGQLHSVRAHKHTQTHTQVAILEKMRLEHLELSSTADQRAMPCGQFSGGFSFSQGQMGFSWNNTHTPPCPELHFPPVAVQSELWRSKAR